MEWFQNSFTALKISSVFCLFILPSFLQPLAATDPFCSLYSFAFSRISYIGIIYCGAFSFWLLSLSSMNSRFLHVFSYLDSTLFSTKWCSILWMYHSLFSHSPTEGHPSCFQVWESMKKRVMFFPFTLAQRHCW